MIEPLFRFIEWHRSRCDSLQNVRAWTSAAFGICCDDGKIYWANSTRQGARGVLQDGIGKYGSYWKTAALYRQSLGCV
jgi:hypothetical protein